MGEIQDRHRKAFVLLSGGVDSATTLYVALQQFFSVTAVGINYGQRHIRELNSALMVANEAGIKFEVIPLHGLAGQHTMLTNKGAAIPEVSYDEIKGISPTYVPFRNGSMLSAIAAHSMKYIDGVIVGSPELTMDSPELKDLCAIYFGAHAEDARNWAYPDCTPEFVGAMANAIFIGTYQTTRLHAPFIHSSKSDIIRAGAELGVPYHLTWSCYAGGDKHCGVCPTCRARRKAFHDAGVKDPTEYASG